MSNGTSNNHVLVRSFGNLYPEEFAAVLNRHRYEDIAALLDLLSSEDRINVVASLFQPHATRYLEQCTESQLDVWFAEADVRVVVRIWNRLAEATRVKAIGRITDQRRHDRIQQLVHVAKDTVGSKIDPVFLEVHGQESVARVRTLLKENPDYEGPILITDNTHSVTGSVHPRRLIRSESDTPVNECLQTTRRLPAQTPVRNAVNLPEWQTSRYLPVVDRMNRPLGLVSRDDLIASSLETNSQKDRIENVLLDITESMFDSVADLFKTLERSK